MEQQWYSVRSIFKLPASPDGQRPPLFEERVVIFRAASPDQALEKGRAEAKRYSEGESQPKMLDHIVALHLWEEELHEGEEVWSCLRQLDVSDEEFLDVFMKESNSAYATWSRLC
jgi:Domain of unknown function (DUF4288)